MARLVVAAALALASRPLPAAAQSSLGGQRVGTSSGNFLRIGMGAKAVAMGEAFVAVADDPSALYWNPAGIAGSQSREVLFSHTAWLTDVNVEYLAFVAPVPQIADGVAGFQVAGLWTELEETTELQPDGTGRDFTYSDVLVGLGYARYFTDKFAAGANVKVLREDLASAVGGGIVTTWLMDVGTMYHLGFHNMNFSVVISNFGPDLDPDEGYDRISHTSGVAQIQETEYIGFSPPTTFKMGLSSTLYETDELRGIGSLEMNRPGDNAETLKLGGELLYRNMAAVRLGYDTNADDMHLSGGLGLRVRAGESSGQVDYAFTHSESFGRIDRLSLSVAF
jgi:hypothetical protein